MRENLAQAMCTGQNGKCLRRDDNRSRNFRYESAARSNIVGSTRWRFLSQSKHIAKRNRQTRVPQHTRSINRTGGANARRILKSAKVSDSPLKSLPNQKYNGVLASGEALEKFARQHRSYRAEIANSLRCARKMLLDKNLLEVKIKSARKRISFWRLTPTESSVKAVSSDLGGGRTKTTDKIDFQIGFSCEKKIGDAVQDNESLGVLICRSEAQADSVIANLQTAFQIEDEPPQRLELIKRS